MYVTRLLYETSCQMFLPGSELGQFEIKEMIVSAMKDKLAINTQISEDLIEEIRNQSKGCKTENF